MTLKVLIAPAAETVPENTGIGRVMHAQHRYLSEFGIELVSDSARADVLACHTQQFDLPRVDCLHLHGAYWTGEPESGRYVNWHHQANQKIVAAARRAQTITVPSEWVAVPFRRDLRVQPVVIGHGLDIDAWTPAEPGDYILYNKNREGDVCTALYAWELAQRGLRVISTFAPRGKAIPETLGVTGQLPHAEMHEVIRHAGVYLATTKETFGIGTLEALACGVPVLGFDWGGTRDLVRHRIDGYLARPRDVNDLLQGYAYIREHRAELSAAARERAQRFAWREVIGQYAALYARIYAEMSAEPTGVSVVITNYNYGRWVGEAIDSVLAQSYPVDEVIVIDDGSTDDSRKHLQKYIETPHPRVTVEFTSNQGVAAARNRGVEMATQPFVVCLDADDRLAPQYVETCRQALFLDRGLGLAWTGLGFIQPDGRISDNFWTGAFDWEWQATAQVPPHTCVPTAAMFRKSMWTRAGGYKQRYAPGEDAEFYTRGLSVGFTGCKVSEDTLIHYRNHPAGAHTRPYVAIDDDKPWMHDKLFPLGAPSRRAPRIRSYSEPLVSVIVPVTRPEHLPDTLDRLLGQSFWDWEVLVVNDTGLSISEELRPYPFAQVIEDENGGAPYGQGEAIKAGCQAAQAPLCAVLTESDRWTRETLATAVQEFAERGQSEGVKFMSCCGGNGDLTLAAKRAAAGLVKLPPEEIYPAENLVEGLVRMKFTGNRVGAVTYAPPRSGRQYRGGNNPIDRYANAEPVDVAWLEGTGVWTRVALPQPEPVPAPEPAPEPAMSVEPVAASDPIFNPVPAGVALEAEPLAEPPVATIDVIGERAAEPAVAMPPASVETPRETERPRRRKNAREH